jgi:hypothetical protein
MIRIHLRKLTLNEINLHQIKGQAKAFGWMDLFSFCQLQNKLSINPLMYLYQLHQLLDSGVNLGEHPGGDLTDTVMNLFQDSKEELLLILTEVLQQLVEIHQHLVKKKNPPLSLLHSVLGTAKWLRLPEVEKAIQVLESLDDSTLVGKTWLESL